YELKEFDPESLYRKIGSGKRGKGGKKFFSTLMNMAGMGDWVKLGDSIKNFYNTFSQDNHSEKGKLKMYEDQNEMIMKELLNSIELEFNKEERIKKELRHFDLESRNIDDLYIELFTVLNNVVNLYYEAISKKIFLLRQNLKSKYKSYY